MHAFQKKNKNKNYITHVIIYSHYWIEPTISYYKQITMLSLKEDQNHYKI